MMKQKPICVIIAYLLNQIVKFTETTTPPLTAAAK